MNDVFGLTGIGLIGYGTAIRYGADMACIIVGVLFVTLAIIGAMRK